VGGKSAQGTKWGGWKVHPIGLLYPYNPDHRQLGKDTKPKRWRERPHWHWAKGTILRTVERELERERRGTGANPVKIKPSPARGCKKLGTLWGNN